MKSWTSAAPLLGLAIGFHFALLALGMLRVSLPKGPLWSVQYNYGRVTGAGGSFGFFSPNVPREIDVEFEVTTPDQRVIHTTLQEMVVPEVRARVSNMVRLVAKSFHREKVLRSIAASLTAAVYRRYPDATSVTLNAYVYNFPTLEAYANGRRPEQTKVYSATFARGG